MNNLVVAFAAVGAAAVLYLTLTIVKLVIAAHRLHNFFTQNPFKLPSKLPPKILAIKEELGEQAFNGLYDKFKNDNNIY